MRSKQNNLRPVIAILSAWIIFVLTVFTVYYFNNNRTLQPVAVTQSNNKQIVESKLVGFTFELPLGWSIDTKYDSLHQGIYSASMQIKSQDYAVSNALNHGQSRLPHRGALLDIVIYKDRSNISSQELLKSYKSYGLKDIRVMTLKGSHVIRHVEDNDGGTDHYATIIGDGKRATLRYNDAKTEDMKKYQDSFEDIIESLTFIEQ